MENRITQEDLRSFAVYLRQEEKSEGTIEKYLRDTAGFAVHVGDHPVTNCGCNPKKRSCFGGAEDLTGQRFGELTVISRAPNNAWNRMCWRCRCDCGKECTVQALNLKIGRTKSCGCRRCRLQAASPVGENA